MKFELQPDKILAIAKKEFMDNVRSKWVLALTVVFTLLTIVMSYFGGALDPSSGVGFQGFQATVMLMSAVTSILLPIIAIMLGYGTIVGEKENGSLGVVLSCPVSRFDLVLGKFCGLGGVMFTTIFAGFGLAGIVITVMSSGADWLIYIAFMLGTFIFTMVFLGFSILMSALAKKRSTAMGGGVLLWFSGMILGIILMGVYMATGGSFADMYNEPLPNWYWAMEFLNFQDIYPIGSMLLFGIDQMVGIQLLIPDFVNVWTVFGWMFFVSALTLVLSMLLMDRKDI